MSKRKRQEMLSAYALLFPAILLLLVFMLIPMINSAWYSLFKWNLVGEKKFVGLSNFSFMFGKDASFKKALLNTCVYTIINMVSTLILALGCALLFQKQSRVNSIWRAIIFVPVVVPMTVMGMVWKMLYEPQYGAINQILSAIGISGPKWLFDSKVAMLAVILFNVWKEFGLYSIILVGGLQKIPAELYEAASVEGANWWQSFRRITMPMLRPIMFFTTTILLINSFKAFDHIWVMTNGGPGNSTTTLVTYIYTKVFDSVGLASAASVVLFVMVFLVTMVKNYIGRDGAIDE